MCNLKCERCGTWSSVTPLANIEEDLEKDVTLCTCGKCYHTSTWYLDAPVPILIPYKDIHGKEPEWAKYKNKEGVA